MCNRSVKIFSQHSVDKSQRTDVTIINNTTQIYVRHLILQEDEKEDWEKNAYKIMNMLGPDPETGETGVIDIPEEYVQTKNYM